MDPAQFARVKSILIEAQHRQGDERRAYLDEACGADDGLRAEVESLLSHADPGPSRARSFSPFRITDRR